MNSTVNALLNATLTADQVAALPAGSNTTKTLWDLIDPKLRFLLLNQTAVSASWNVTQALSLNQTKLDWATIPSSVQAILQQEQQSQQIAQLSFLAWGWVNSNTDMFANTTLASLLSTQSKALLPNMTALVSQLHFESVVNMTLLKGNRCNDLIESAMQIMQFNGIRIKRANGFHNSMERRTRPPPPPPTPFDVITRVMMQTQQVLRTYLPRSFKHF